MKTNKIRLITFLSLTVVMILALTASAAEWHVPGDFSTIQAAINSSLVLDSDRIHVGSGSYAGATITKAIEIKGADGSTVIDSGPSLFGYVAGFILPSNGSGTGATISHMRFEVDFPVYSLTTDDVAVVHSTMINPIQGVTNWSGNNWDISHNEIIDLSFVGAGGIGIVVGARTLGQNVLAQKNLVSHNKIHGTMHVTGGGDRDGAGIDLIAFGNAGLTVTGNRALKNKVSLVSENPGINDVGAMVVQNNACGNDVSDNKIGFNDFRGTELQVELVPDGCSLDNPVNKISRNLGDNRGHGLHPSEFFEE